MKLLRFLKYILITLAILFIIIPTYSNNIIWQKIGNPLGLRIESFSFNSKGDIFITTWWHPDEAVLNGARYRIERSTDKGSTWTPVLEPGWAPVCATINKESHIFVGTIGIVRKSTDNGDTWEITNDELPVSFIHTLAISPEGHIYLGANSENYRSTDGGYNWTKLDLEFGAKTFVFKEDSHIFAGVYPGNSSTPQYIYRSADNGETWEQVLCAEKTYYWSIALNSKGDIFAATSGYDGSIHGGVYRSKDNGENWTQINYGLPNLKARSIIIDSNDHIFAAISGSGVYCSIDNGENWIEVNDGLSDIRVKCLGINPENDIFVGTGASGIPASEGGHVFRNSVITSVNQIINKIPDNFTLEQNYPNPFNSTTTIKFSIPNSKYVSLKIYNILGQEISTLFSGKLPSGEHEVHWIAHNLPSGIYFCRLQSGSFTKSIKMVLLP